MPKQRALSIKEMIERTPANGNEAESMKGALREYADAVANLEKVQATRDPTMTTAAHQKRIADAAKRVEKFVEKQDAKFTEKFNTTMRVIRQRITDEANLKPTRAAPEIRAALLSMDANKRLEVIQTAFKNKNSEVIAAIREGPAMLSGLDDQVRDSYVTDYEKSYAPTATAEAEAVLEVFNVQHVVAKTATEAAREAADPIQIKQIDEARDAAKAADNDFKETVKDPAVG